MLLNTLENYGTHEKYQTLEHWQEACDQLLQTYSYRFYNKGYEALDEAQQEDAFEWACSNA